MNTKLIRHTNSNNVRRIETSIYDSPAAAFVAMKGEVDTTVKTLAILFPNITDFKVKRWNTSALIAHKNNFIRWVLSEYVEGFRHLIPKDIDFEGEIADEGNGIFSFYVRTTFDLQIVFGDKVHCNDGFVNIYAKYDAIHGCVCEDLEIFCSDNAPDPNMDHERSYLYKMTESERVMMQGKMFDYDCGYTLQNMITDYEPDTSWFIGYPGGCCYVNGKDARDVKIDELVNAGHNIDDIHVFPASAEVE